MLEGAVAAVGFVVQAGANGHGYVLSTWVRYVGALESEKATYEVLSLEEMHDVMAEVICDNRPGSVRLEGGDQPTLWMS